MINISKEAQERCKTDPAFLREVLQEELTKTLLGLVGSPLELIPKLQGRAVALQEIIKLLP